MPRVAITWLSTAKPYLWARRSTAQPVESLTFTTRPKEARAGSTAGDGAPVAIANVALSSVVAATRAVRLVETTSRVIALAFRCSTWAPPRSVGPRSRDACGCATRPAGLRKRRRRGGALTQVPVQVFHQLDRDRVVEDPLADDDTPGPGADTGPGQAERLGRSVIGLAGLTGTEGEEGPGQVELSRSAAVSQRSASRRAENVGLSGRCSPWQARWTMPGPGRASRRAALVASSSLSSRTSPATATMRSDSATIMGARRSGTASTSTCSERLGSARVRRATGAPGGTG